jgi:hypothetical protein
LLRLKIPDDRFDYDIKKHRSLVLKGYKFRPLAVWRDGDNNSNNNGDDSNTSNGSKNNNKNSSNNSGNNIVTTTTETVEPSEPTSAESNKKHVEDKDKDRDTLDKILFALFSEENGGYFRCPVCNDSVRYTSPYTLSQHVCYAHARNYDIFDADGVSVKVQDFIRLLQKFYPITEDYGWTYFIRKLGKNAGSTFASDFNSGNRNAV